MRRNAFVTSAAVLIICLTVRSHESQEIQQPIPPEQRAVLDRANLGLQLLAAKSPRARQLYLEAKPLARRRKFARHWFSNASVTTKTDSLDLTVCPERQGAIIATYAAASNRIAFYEPACADLSVLTLGLVYAHELQHRWDYFNGVYTATDQVDSRSRKTTEVNARRAALAILREYTNNRWDEMITDHLAAYWRMAPQTRRKYPSAMVWLTTDADWMHQEFGRLSMGDVSYLINLAAFDAASRFRQRFGPVTAADMLHWQCSLISNK